jgi:L-lactate dehydrogenase complex protein LldE
MPERVQLFITCIIDTLYPEIGRSAYSVLKKCGQDIEFPADQTCCGQPAFNAGMRNQAVPVAKHTIEVFEKRSGPIVIPSGSCTAMLRHGYPELFKDDPAWEQRAADLSQRVFEFTEFLVDRLGVYETGSTFSGQITYHSSCHLLRDLGVDEQPRLLLENLQKADFIELPFTSECCGFGGVFSVEHPEISNEMLKRKINNITDSGSPVVVSCDAGCMTNINGGLHRRNLKPRVLHIAQVLDA